MQYKFKLNIEKGIYIDNAYELLAKILGQEELIPIAEEIDQITNFVISEDVKVNFHYYIADKDKDKEIIDYLLKEEYKTIPKLKDARFELKEFYYYAEHIMGSIEGRFEGDHNTLKSIKKSLYIENEKDEKEWIDIAGLYKHPFYKILDNDSYYLIYIPQFSKKDNELQKKANKL